jgi:hypothetical protein
MATVRAAQVNMDTLLVENVGIIGNPIPVLTGVQFILEKDWGPDQTPNVGQLWDGNSPATFSDAPPPVITDQPANLDEAQANVDTAMVNLQSALAAQAALLSA